MKLIGYYFNRTCIACSINTQGYIMNIPNSSTYQQVEGIGRIKEEEDGLYYFHWKSGQGQWEQHNTIKIFILKSKTNYSNKQYFIMGKILRHHETQEWFLVVHASDIFITGDSRKDVLKILIVGNVSKQPKMVVNHIERKSFILKLDVVVIEYSKIDKEDKKVFFPISLKSTRNNWKKPKIIQNLASVGSPIIVHAFIETKIITVKNTEKIVLNFSSYASVEIMRGLDRNKESRAYNMIINELDMIVDNHDEEQSEPSEHNEPVTWDNNSTDW